MTRTATAPKAVALPLCGCGCGNPVKSTKSVYVPGHDARHAGLVAREAFATGDQSAIRSLPSQALRVKAAKMVARLSEPKPSKSVKAEAVKSVQPVKVGRWTYPAMVKDGALLRNTKRDGSGEWVAA